MGCFRVSFYKTVSNDQGAERKVCQGAFDVVAEDESAALKSAQALFCARDHMSNWSCHADSHEIVRPVANSATPRSRALRGARRQAASGGRY